VRCRALLITIPTELLFSGNTLVAIPLHRKPRARRAFAKAPVTMWGFCLVISMTGFYDMIPSARHVVTTKTCDVEYLKCSQKICKFFSIGLFNVGESPAVATPRIFCRSPGNVPRKHFLAWDISLS
jgi:hypothetical protein